MFCTTCGKEITSGNGLQLVCSNCGASNSRAQAGRGTEEIVFKIELTMEIGFAKGSKYDLYFTENRLVAIKMTGAARVGGAAFGIAGRLAENAIRNRQANKKRNEQESLSLDQMLQEDAESNYEIRYDSVVSMKVASSMMQKLVEVKYGNEQKSKKFALTKETISLLKEKLPHIRALEGKLILPN